MGNPNWVKGKPAPGAKPFTSDHQPERKRQPSELRRLQDTGYNIEDIRKGITTTLTMTVQDLEHLSQRESAPIIFRIMGKAALTAFKNGDLEPIKEMFKYVFPRGATVNVQQNFAEGRPNDTKFTLEIVEVVRTSQDGPMDLSDLISGLNPQSIVLHDGND